MHNALLLNTEFNPELTPGAVNAVTTCLRIQPGEKVTLICDEACLTIGASLARELEARGLVWSGFILEKIAPRPLTDMPAEVISDMESSAISP